MSDDRGRQAEAGGKAGGFLGSLKDALAAASREDTARLAQQVKPLANVREIAPEAKAPEVAAAGAPAAPAQLSAAEAAREARVAIEAGTTRPEAPPTTRVFRSPAKPEPAQARTQLVRGKAQVKRGSFEQDPVVGWLVVVGGPGMGAFRPIFEGNNTIGRASTQRIPLDFGDDAISSEEQAYIRYDGNERSFLFVPNLAKTNVVSVNSKRPTGAVELSAMDLITIGRTQVAFVPFCGAEFDWSEIADKE